MHTHYKASCDECKEMCEIVVTSTFHVVTDHYLKENNSLIVAFLNKHFSHSLKFTHDNGDGYLDKCLSEGYINVKNLAEDAKKEYVLTYRGHL